MKILKNRKIAILITVIIVVLATLFGVGRSLNRLARSVEAMIYIVDIHPEGDAREQWDINRHLANLEQAVLNNLDVFTEHYGLSNEAKALRDARRIFMDAETVSDVHAAYQMILLAGTEFINKAETMELSERERDKFTSFQDTFRGATGAIQRSEYNEMARGFMDEASIIARVLRPFVFVTSPQTFDE